MFQPNIVDHSRFCGVAGLSKLLKTDQMTPDEPLDLDFIPFVPPKVRLELTKRLKGCTRIVISECEDNRTRKVNGIKLDTKPGQMPRTPVDDIAQLVTNVMHTAWVSQETEDPDVGLPPMEFVVVCENTNNKRERHQFKYTYHAEMDMDEGDASLSDHDAQVDRIIASWERLATTAIDEKTASHEKLLEVVQQNTAGASAGAALMANAIPLFLGGNQAMLNAKFMEYSDVRAREDAKASGDRWASTMQTLAPLGMILMMQMLGKAGIDPGMVAPLLGGMMPGAGAPPAGAPPSQAHAPGPTAAAEAEDLGDAGLDDDLPPGMPGQDQQLAALAYNFGNSLRPHQRRELNKLLTKKQVAAFDDLFCSATDNDALLAYQVVMQTCMDKLPGMQALLEPHQTQALHMFLQAAASSAPPTA